MSKCVDSCKKDDYGNYRNIDQNYCVRECNYGTIFICILLKDNIRKKILMIILVKQY